MTIAAAAVLNQAIAEVRYTHGIVYLDKCGSLMLELERKLGQPFTGSVMPTLEAGELRSRADRMIVRYGPKQLSLTQTWAASPTRLEQLAPGAWQVLSSSLGVRRTVTRCGVRFLLLWSVDTQSEAEERLARSGLISETKAWLDLFGASEHRSVAGVVDGPSGGKCRVALEVVETHSEGEIPEDLRRYAPPFAIMLDLDSFLGDGSTAMTLEQGQFREHVQSSWATAQRLSARVGEALQR